MQYGVKNIVKYGVTSGVKKGVRTRVARCLTSRHSTIPHAVIHDSFHGFLHAVVHAHKAWKNEGMRLDPVAVIRQD